VLAGPTVVTPIVNERAAGQTLQAIAHGLMTAVVDGSGPAAIARAA
jgi:hypothetical protein